MNAILESDRLVLQTEDLDLQTGHLDLRLVLLFLFKEQLEVVWLLI